MTATAKKKKAADIKNREELFTHVMRDLLYADLNQVAQDSGVHLSTLYLWVNGEVFAPRVSTLFPVARALGYDISFTRPSRRGRRPRLRRVK